MTDKAQFTLTGFKQQGEFRVFTFENAGVKTARTEFSVRANLTLIRKYAIQLQELPLLCRGLLERPAANDEAARAFTYTEEEMAAHATNAAEARRNAALRRKPPRRPPNANAGSAWRDERSASLPAPMARLAEVDAK